MKKRLYKSDKDKKVCGVCGGIANYFDVDQTVIRLAWVIFTLAGGSGTYRIHYSSNYNAGRSGIH